MGLILFFLYAGVFVLGFTAALILRAALVRPQDCRYILVLGTKVGSVSLQERICCAYAYLTAHPHTVAILTGGKSTDHPLSEAEYMFRALTDMGIDSSRLRMEDRATSTWTNLRYSLSMLEGDRPTEIGIVTHGYHLFRAAMHGADQGVAVRGIPAPAKNKLRWLFGFFREIAGVWHYIILGGRYL